MKKIMLYGKYGVGKYAIVDDEDFEELNKYKWLARLFGKDIFYAIRSVYNPSTGKISDVRMHRAVCNMEDKKLVIDHINRDGLDNRKKNLRIVSKRENNRNKVTRTNTGEYLISKTKRGGGFAVSYTTNDITKKNTFKRFKDIKSAIIFRDEILQKYYNFTSNIDQYRKGK